MDPKVKFGRYSIRSVLGTGAMSIVYEGYDDALDRTVAIKTIRKDLLESDEADQLRERFRREARIIARLKHENFIAVFELVEDWDPPFMAMELIKSKNLAQLAKERYSFSFAQAKRIGLDLLSALEYLHAQSLIHRDIKPANLFWSSGEPLKVADFGVARTGTSTLTQHGSAIGTPAYMAPEQFNGDSADTRADLWAVGVVLYELVTGTRCFKGDYDTVRRAVTAQDPFEFPVAQQRILGTDFEAILRKSLAKNPENRFKNAREFSEALRAAADRVEPYVSLDPSTRTLTDYGALSSAAVTPSRIVAAADEAATVLVDRPTKSAASVSSTMSLRIPSRGVLISLAAMSLLGIAAYGAYRFIDRGSSEIDGQEVERIVQSVSCSEVQFSIENRMIRLSGYIPNEESKAELKSQLEKARGIERVSMLLETRPWPFCELVRVTKPFGKAHSENSGGMHIRVEGYSGQLRQGEQVKLEMKAPALDGYVYIDYYQADRNVIHLFPAATSAPSKVAANQEIMLDAGTVSSPFGDEMLVMISSPTPLFSQMRPQYEAVDQYLPVLKSELAKHSAGKLLSDYMFLKTVR